MLCKISLSRQVSLKLVDLNPRVDGCNSFALSIEPKNLFFPMVNR